MCWRCMAGRGTTDHIWYGCHLVNSFWIKVFEIYQKVSGVERTPSIEISLLSLMTKSIRNIKTDILHHMTTAARKVIAQKWRNTTSPSIAEWICEMNEIQYMEREEGYINNQMPGIWQQCEEFRSSMRIIEYL